MIGEKKFGIIRKNKRLILRIKTSLNLAVSLTHKIEISNCREIGAKEYCLWHQTGRFQNLIFQVGDENKKYYVYDFKNPQRLAKAIKVNV